MLSATIRIESPDAETMLSSLKPETEHVFPRTHVEVSCSDGIGIIAIEANDTTAMRAALNSYLGCIRITEEISKITKVKV